MARADSVAFESSGKGFGGDIGIMVGVNTADDRIIGVGVTTHSETPGVGAKAKTDPVFCSSIQGQTAGRHVSGQGRRRPGGRHQRGNRYIAGRQRGGDGRRRRSISG